MRCRRKTEGLDEIERAILGVLVQSAQSLACKEIAQAAGLPTPKVTGKMRSLKNRGYVEDSVKGKYVITESGKK